MDVRWSGSNTGVLGRSRLARRRAHGGRAGHKDFIKILAIAGPGTRCSLRFVGHGDTAMLAAPAPGLRRARRITGSQKQAAETERQDDGICDAAHKYSFLANVTHFAPPDCSDGWGTAEVVFEVYLDEVFESRSSEALRPAQWPLDSFSIDGAAAVRLSFLEADGFSDDPLADLCWRDDAGNCEPIPPEILHDEGFDGLTADGRYELSLVIIRE